MFRTVADDPPSPAAVTSSDEATGSPEVMYSRTSAARTRRERSGPSISTLVLGLLSPLYRGRGRSPTSFALSGNSKVFRHPGHRRERTPHPFCGNVIAGIQTP